MRTVDRLHVAIGALAVDPAVFRRFPGGCAAFVQELPDANTQGATLEEARANLTEAVALVLQANRELAEEELRGQEVIREPLLLGAA